MPCRPPHLDLRAVPDLAVNVKIPGLVLVEVMINDISADQVGADDGTAVSQPDTATLSMYDKRIIDRILKAGHGIVAYSHMDTVAVA